jgi:mono/diheme cytochrome c family protein
LQRRASISALIFALALAALSSGCEKDRSQMSDAELGLTPQQASGRRVFNIYCVACHPAYSSHGNKGPGLKDLFKKQYLPSGLTSTDEHVEQSIIRGRNMMPPFPQISGEDLANVIAYLHTL